MEGDNVMYLKLYPFAGFNRSAEEPVVALIHLPAALDPQRGRFQDLVKSCDIALKEEAFAYEKQCSRLEHAPSSLVSTEEGIRSFLDVFMEHDHILRSQTITYGSRLFAAYLAHGVDYPVVDVACQ